jgi:HAD superfamily hydrolase (TIGR01509 family)
VTNESASTSAPNINPNIEAVIFDLDGVLADSERVHLEAARRLLAPAELTIEDYERFVGGSFEDYSDWIEATYRVPKADFRARYTETIVDLLRFGPSPAMPGADAIVRAVHRRGLRVAVASMSEPPWVTATLRATGLTDLIPLVVTGVEVEHAKPHPEIYLHTAALLGVDPAACIAVEDSVNGTASAVAAGMIVVQTRQGFLAPPRQPGVHAVIESWAQFDLRWLEGRPVEGIPTSPE